MVTSNSDALAAGCAADKAGGVCMTVGATVASARGFPELMPPLAQAIRADLRAPRDLSHNRAPEMNNAAVNSG
jgi:hypothetical protein